MQDNFSTIYLIRHGQSEGNINEKVMIQGQTEFPLTKEGEDQVKKLSKELSDIEFAAIYSSDLIRTKRTAEIIAEEKKMAVIATHLLRENKVGRFEGELEKDLREEFEKLREIKYSLPKPERDKFRFDENSESTEEILGRLIPYLRELALAYPGKNILVITHAALIRIFLVAIGYVHEHREKDFKIQNTAFIKLESNGIDFFVKEIKGIEMDNT